MGSKKDREEVDNIELVEEVHDRLDALLYLLEKKGVINEGEYSKELEEIYNKRENNEE